MDARRAALGRPWSRSLRPIALLLATLLLVGGGPGLAASSVRPLDPRTRGTADQIQDDPIGNMALALDYDLDTIFRFVADEVAYEPYPGILRGALGTLEARAGNSADKALLLAALLDASLIPVRFARGPMEEAAAAQLTASLTVDAETARSLAQRPLDAGVAQLAEREPDTEPDPGTSPLLDETQEAALEADGQAALGQAATRLGDTAAMLQAALADAGIALPDRAVTIPATELSEHVWVQAQFGPEWQDLDATLAGAEPGTPLATTTDTLDQLPDDLRHRVRFDVIVERVEAGALATHTILEHEAFADELTGVPVVFGHVTPSGVKTLGITLGSLFGEGWIDYRPSLDLGGRAIVADEAVGFPATAGGGDIFSVEPSPGAGEAGPVEGEATAEWLEVTVTSPGGEPATARRTVFDRVPAAARHGGTPAVADVAPITLVDLEGTGTVGYPPMEGMQAFAIATGTTSLAPLLAVADDGLGMLALAYHNLRDVMTTSLVLDAGGRTYLDAPNVVSVALRIDPDATAETLRESVRFGIDLWHRSHGVLPIAGGATTAGDAEILAGITDHLAERFAIAFAGRTELVAPGSVGVGEVFEAAEAQDIPTVVLQGALPAGLPYAPEVVAAIGERVDAGDVVVIPAEPVAIGEGSRVGWWVIDPVTGHTTDTMDDGTASEFAEYGFVVRTRIGLVRCYGALAAVVVGYLAAATSALTVMNIMSDFAPGAGAAATCAAL
jgi:hypothetical protein